MAEGAALQEGMQTLRQLDVTQSSQATQGRGLRCVGAATAAAAIWRVCRHSIQVRRSLHVRLRLLCWPLLQLLSLRQGGRCWVWLSMMLLAVLASDEQG